MPRSEKQRKAQEAWSRIEALGGNGVWEPDMVVVSFGKTKIKDDDLALFKDFPSVQILDLSNTKITDKALTHLAQLELLEELIVTDTKITSAALKAFQRAHPSVKITTGPPPKGTIDPFTGKPIK